MILKPSSLFASMILLLATACGGGGGGGAPAAEVPVVEENPAPEPDPPSSEAPTTSDPPDEEFDPAAWEVQMKLFAGENAKDCGALTIGDTVLDPIIECMRTSFEVYAPFFGSRTRPGTDSVLRTGVAYDGMNLFFIFADRLGPSPRGYVIEECVEPRYLDEESFPPFECDELVETEPMEE